MLTSCLSSWYLDSISFKASKRDCSVFTFSADFCRYYFSEVRISTSFSSYRFSSSSFFKFIWM